MTVSHPSRADEVYQQLKRDIADFRLVPGDRITETEISERLSVSRTPVRQALFRLRQEGYVDVLFRSGWQVRPFDFDKFDQLYDLRRVIEEEVVPLFYDCDASGLPAGWIARMKHALTSLAWRYNANRMVLDYTRQCYLPAADALTSSLSMSSYY